MDAILFVLGGNRYDSNRDFAVDFDTLEEFYTALTEVDSIMNDGKPTFVFISKLIMYFFVGVDDEVLIVSYNHLKRRGDVCFHARFDKELEFWYGDQRVIFPKTKGGCRISETNGLYLQDDEILAGNVEMDLKMDPDQAFFNDEHFSYFKKGKVRGFDAQYQVWVVDEDEGGFSLVTCAPHYNKFIPKKYKGAPLIRKFECVM